MKEYIKINTIWKRDDRGNIQEGQYSLPVFEYLKDAEWVFTEKVDGTNIRVYWDGASVRFGGRSDAAQIPATLVDHLRKAFTEQAMLAKFGPAPACLYGEGFGAKIQAGGGNYKPDGQSFVLFDVLIDKWWLKREDVDDVAMALDIPVVPLVFKGTLAQAEAMVKNGVQSLWGSFQAEGLVGRPREELFDRNGDRVIVKMKTKDYAPRKQRQEKEAVAK